MLRGPKPQGCFQIQEEGVPERERESELSLGGLPGGLLRSSTCAHIPHGDLGIGKKAIPMHKNRGEFSF